MKKLSKVIAVVLALAVILSVQAFAYEIKEVESVDITVSTEIAGKKVSDYKDFIKINSEDFVFNDMHQEIDEEPTVIAKDVQGNKVEEFLPGRKYVLTIYLASSKFEKISEENFTVTGVIKGTSSDYNKVEGKPFIIGSYEDDQTGYPNYIGIKVYVETEGNVFTSLLGNLYDYVLMNTDYNSFSTKIATMYYNLYMQWYNLFI